MKLRSIYALPIFNGIYRGKSIKDLTENEVEGFVGELASLLGIILALKSLHILQYVRRFEVDVSTGRNEDIDILLLVKGVTIAVEVHNWKVRNRIACKLYEKEIRHPFLEAEKLLGNLKRVLIISNISGRKNRVRLLNDGIFLCETGIHLSLSSLINSEGIVQWIRKVKNFIISLLCQLLSSVIRIKMSRILSKSSSKISDLHRQQPRHQQQNHQPTGPPWYEFLRRNHLVRKVKKILKIAETYGLIKVLHKTLLFAEDAELRRHVIGSIGGNMSKLTRLSKQAL